MKRYSAGLALVLACGSAVRGAPPTTVPAAEVGRPIELCFVLDTTGSMGGLIDGAKRKIWSIANDVISRRPQPRSIRIALVAYRDRGDAYVTQVFDLTDDIDTVYKNLQTFRADGGGDEPESVNQALDDAVGKVHWSDDRDATRILFLVGDAPPHMDYADDVKFPLTCERAVRKNVVIDTVQCGSIASTTPVWQEIARRGEGAFVQLGQTGDMVAIDTPMDAELSTLNRRMGTTLVNYAPAGGAGGGRYSDAAAATQAAKQAASESAPASVIADRLNYNMASRRAVQGDDELIDALADKRVAMKDLKDDQLPPELRKLSPADREAKVKQLAADREEIRRKIADLSKQRDAYIAAERKKQTGKPDAFDAEVAKIVADQANRPRR